MYTTSYGTTHLWVIFNRRLVDKFQNPRVSTFVIQY